MKSSKRIDSQAELKVADEVWIATALLHKENSKQTEFTVEEIVERAKKAGLTKHLRPGVYVHVVQHCVANRPSNPGRYRMLFESSAGHRRLFRNGDSYSPDREGGKITPRSQDLPYGYSSLLNWYRDWCSNATENAIETDSLLSLKGSGRQLWRDEHADDYVRRLREGWK